MTSPLGNVATHYLRGSNNNCGEDGANLDFIQYMKEWLGVPRFLTNSLYGRGVLELLLQASLVLKSKAPNDLEGLQRSDHQQCCTTPVNWKEMDTI